MSIIYNNFIGVDIGKFEFVVAVHGSNTTYAFSNDKEGLDKLYSELGATLKDSLVVLETTGGYEKRAIEYLQKENISVHRANARQVKSFIRSYGIIGKSDRIDAIALANYAFERQHVLQIFKPNKHELIRELYERRSDLVRMRTQETNRSKAPSSSSLVSDSLQMILKLLNEQIAIVDEKISSTIAEDKELKIIAKVLKTVSGIGPVTANAIIAQMPEIGTMNQKQVASLAGLAPHPNQSGTKTGYCRTRGGRRGMRVTLFMPALTISRGDSVLGKFYKRLVEAGKPKMCALTAVMRKIIVIANSKVKQELAAENSATA